ncbi:MAG: hypothetical protein F6K11_34195 [Leptolyngbya sp. SIO3F4]|nr:hypothetical protein [Leptolyngbya sp. SIO3F4]
MATGFGKTSIQPTRSHTKPIAISNLDEQFVHISDHIGQDCLYRAYHGAGCLGDEAKAMAGQVFAWDSSIGSYDNLYTFHSWVIHDGKLWDSHAALTSVLKQSADMGMDFPGLLEKGVSKLIAKAKIPPKGVSDRASIAQWLRKHKDCDLLYVPGCVLLQAAMHKEALQAIRDTGKYGFYRLGNSE